MKRDIDLCLQILREFEEQPPGGIQATLDAVGVAHVDLMIDAGLLEGECFPGQPPPGGTVLVNKITWAGHDFLDAARDEGTWQKAKDRLVKAGGWTFSLVIEVLKDEAKKRLGLLLPE